MNKVILDLIRKGAGITTSKRDVIGSSLDYLAGGWDEADAKEFSEAIKSCEQIDEELWK